MEDHVKDLVPAHVPEYEPPRVVDYGTLVDITRAGNAPNADVPHGNNNTAFPVS
jgi:hypothetical protein